MQKTPVVDRMLSMQKHFLSPFLSSQTVILGIFLRYSAYCGAVPEEKDSLWKLVTLQEFHMKNVECIPVLFYLLHLYMR